MTEPLVEPNEWEFAKNRKKKKKKILNKRQPAFQVQGEAITIKASTSETYADVIKQMKNKIDPTEIGVEIKGIRRTKTGELLVNFKKGDGQAEKLRKALGNMLGDDVTVRTLTRSHTIDIRDLDESTDSLELINALMEATATEEPSSFKILNIRNYFGGTKQALVQLPEHLAAPLLRTGKIRVGWIMCRIRIRVRTKQCYRCMDQGHIASQCKGLDRANICRRCCNPGHKLKEYTADLRCIICQEAGIENTGHYIGSVACVNNRRKAAAK